MGVEMMDMFVSERDLTQLIGRCIDDERLQFAILQGLSDNRFKRLDISDARELVGYAPQDDATTESPAVKPLKLREKVHGHNQREDHQESGLRQTLSNIKSKASPDHPAKRKAKNVR